LKTRNFCHVEEGFSREIPLGPKSSIPRIAGSIVNIEEPRRKQRGMRSL